MKNILDLTSEQLRKAAQIKEQIASLERQLQNVLGEKGSASAASSRMSPAARARISAAAKARWAKFRTGKSTLSSAKQKGSARKTMTAAQKAKIAEAMKARWAKIKAATK